MLGIIWFSFVLNITNHMRRILQTNYWDGQLYALNLCKWIILAFNRNKTATVIINLSSIKETIVRIFGLISDNPID